MASLPFGATVSSGGRRVAFRVSASSAHRVEVWIYAGPTDSIPILSAPMAADGDGTFALMVDVPVPQGPSAGALYYGYRAWGPNWRYNAAWTPGLLVGFVAEVDGDGNRFNPNKLLLDPYAREVSHCVQTPERPDRSAYGSGPAARAIDTGPFAPKGVVSPGRPTDYGIKPTHPFKDDIIYEVHLRGLTMADPLVPPDLRGTYAGAALRAPYLRELGVTAVEFLPIHQTQNALNDCPDRMDDHDYWGYDSMSYFAPDRRYAHDRSPGGPTREWVAMVKAFHAEGIKVFVDVVFNHHEEAGERAADTIYSLRGLDNLGYYETLGQYGRADAYQNDNGVGPNVNAATEVVRDLLMASLHYWSNELGVDGFRFDLAAVLGNAKPEGGYIYDADDPDGLLQRAVRELPARPAGGGEGVDLIAEPYTATGDGQEQGNFPIGWSEWNDRFRDTMRASQNKLGILPITPGALATRFAGSSDLFEGNGRRPWNSVNYIVCHDGFTLRDLHSYDDKHNDQPYPFGPSSGGRSTQDEMCWDHDGDAGQQAQAVRTSLALLMFSAGTPMITGGTEMNRTQYGNNNAYNLDTSANWLNWKNQDEFGDLIDFTKGVIALRMRHPAFRPASFFTGDVGKNGLKDITWFRADGEEADSEYFSNPGNTFLAYQIDGRALGDLAQRLYVGYNAGAAAVQVNLPDLSSRSRWMQIVDTSRSATSWGHVALEGHREIIQSRALLDARSLILAIAN